ncbi:hypothetical protein L873DRAFT_1730461 [Choiromyces venosus 120613-1]|uniref:HECT-type E3 ubiquitin transferase n=1 Tax=Choiromyces venosus 120613-1 TaxID=1336337 RepID=A0A3N4K3B9_9PEZI|nr:hypothetical protein L873DRAFT_1730461 [Choiromyces venosus 120613-1]
MYPTFTGSSRKPRVVNLGGRKTAAAPSRTSQFSRAPAIQTSVLHAQQERAQREAERQRLRAATTVQRVWRSRREAEAQRTKWRKEWDSNFAEGASGNFGEGSDLKKRIEYGVTLFLAFYERGHRPGRHRKRDSGDLLRMKALVHYVAQYLSQASDKSCPRIKARGVDGRGNLMMEKFGKLLIEVLQEEVLTVDSLSVLPSLAVELPGIVDASYYKALSRITTSSKVPSEAILDAVLTPLQHVENANEQRNAEIHRSFAANYLVTSDLPEHLHSGFERLEEAVEFGMLVKAMSECPEQWIIATGEEKLWMLSYIIHFTPSVSGSEVIDLTVDKPYVSRNFEEQSYIHVMSLLLSSVAKEASKRIEVEDISMGVEDDEDEDESSGERSDQSQPLPPFVKSKLDSLIQQSSITSIFSRASFTGSDDRYAKMLAGFALTLLLVFPKVKQEVCMWLCLAETKDGVSALRYLWAAVRRSELFSGVTEDTGIRLAVDSLRKRNLSTDDASVRGSGNDEWNLILLFIELYGFLLLVMDDDEFFAGDRAEKKARQLPLKEVENLSVFLKNLAFAMYYFGGEIMGEDKQRSDGGAVFFKDQPNQGWEVEYLKTVVTELLKAIYARDSRRKFLPPNHWLMTAAGFNIEGFIPAVVQEEENRHRMENEEEEDGEEPERQYDLAAIAALGSYERRNLLLERMSKIQRKKQRALYLSTITPRLEILQNLPFFIPFATRVQVFREFVSGDQRRRRGGFVDPDQWRAAVLSRSSQLPFPTQGALGDARDNLNRHHATIRRNRVFEDAYEQFWPLGEGLKEPIQITFIDRFGAEEAGIDGGGVTKEFLTGVCGDAFTPSALTEADREAHDDDMDVPSDDEAEKAAEFGKNLFLENEQHLLYPNPTSVEELKEELIRTRGPYQDMIKDEVDALLKRYEFLGRVLGKCLYEGILVDVAFAPFFLLKWSQQASDSKATTAVGVNDLRDLDEGLYRGLVKLKNYTGDVESDFGLNFTISSRLPRHDKTITVELKPGGETITVTNANKLEYIHFVSRYRLSLQVYAQTSAFLRGLNSIINPSWLSMFNQSELQTLVGGDINTPIDVEDLRRNTIYGGVYQIGHDGVEHESIRLFWQVMRSLSDEERRKVLKFVTSVARAPLLGFGVLRPRFSIRDAGEDQGRLCSASTCVNLLKLPRYRDPKILREKLLYSVNSNAGFDLS